MNELKDFLMKYRGAIIGVAIALLVLLLKLYLLVLWIFFLILGAVVGNYVQNNKEFVKDKLKYYIDKL
jgi:uncharacterized membrane protein